jgi:hypothetical protein
MASATVREIESLDTTKNERWFLITEVDPWTGPFFGPADRECADFVVSDDTFASFEWCSRADGVLTLAVDVANDSLGVNDAFADGDLRDYLDRVGADPDAADAGDSAARQAVVETCTAIATRHLDVFEQDAVYAFDDDRHLADAADALSPLPPWARIETIVEGGIGTSYSQPCLVLDESYSLIDLAAHLAAVGQEVL